MKLIVPIAGRSSRFPGMRPKWMLTMPNGKLMLEESISYMDLTNIDEIIIPYIIKQINEFNFNISYIQKSLEAQHNKLVTLCPITDWTISQPATICQAIQASFKDDNSFYIKDCDNMFSSSPAALNEVAFVKLENIELIAAKNKSYILTNRFLEIEQIAEKEVISDKFCCGGYSFESSDLFIQTCESLGVHQNPDLYVSHIIKKLIFNSICFKGSEASDYIDWGTAEEYFQYTRQAEVIFLDFDGVLVKNSSKFALTPWEYEPIEENLSAISEKLKQCKSSSVVITTSRPSTELNNIAEFLKKYQISPKQVVCDLPHCKRLLVNDFSASNPFPSALSVNMPRNASNLADYL